ncbi:hypothetical protein CSA17_07490 [bacterium DOLJORAL78_65_58]|nr:MAG: hypothetical protein CSA17_07490 [bacterium DOLJORAL78_65_58]
MSTSKKHPQTPIRTRNPERVRERVLDASTRLFAAMGFAGTSLRNISDASGVSVGLIQYHFGTKQALYDAVREHALAA